MRVFDNAHPKGRYVGTGPTPVPEAPCCRDGFARLALVRPFQWERPKRPNREDYTRRVYLLCAGCVRLRYSSGAKFDDESEYNPHLAF